MHIDFSSFGSITSLDENRSWSNQQIQSYTNSRVKALVKLGIGPNDKVVIAHGGT